MAVPAMRRQPQPPTLPRGWRVWAAVVGVGAGAAALLAFWATIKIVNHVTGGCG
jgi:hypothetical protein